MAKSEEVLKTETIDKVVSVYENTASVSKTALQVEMSTTKVRKILITKGLWSSKRSKQISELFHKGKSSSEIAEILKITRAMVQNYLPYEKGLYDEDEKTDTAIRSEKYRERNRTYAQKSLSREQDRVKSVPQEKKIIAPSDRKAPYAMQLHLELRDSQLNQMDSSEAKILSKYGKVEKSISRDVIVPSSLALHQLHFLINMAFGWTNSHLHNFELPEALFQKLTEGKIVEIAPVFGYYLKFPNSTFNDEFWDDDYEEHKSPRTWMRSKYLKQYRYGGFSDYWLENQVEIQELAQHLPILDVRPFLLGEKVESKKVKFEEATLQELLNSIMFDQGSPEELKESLRINEVLSLNPVDIEKAKEATLLVDKSSMWQYIQFRDKVMSEKGPQDISTRMYNVDHMESLLKKAEPKDIMPITTKLIYKYDFGDGWKVDISLVQEFGKDNQIVEDETAKKVMSERKPICIAKDGLPVLDDCGNVFGYINMLRTIHEGDKDEAIEMKWWARSQGWTGRDVSIKHLI